MAARSRFPSRLSILLLFSLQQAFAWGPGEPGGMKLGFEGEIFSFSTRTCPGGVFFKEPIHIPLICTHGYFFRRPNGCKMDGSDIVGAQNYACSQLNNDPSFLTQALIPVTNSDAPTDHTLTFFDDADTLQNLRKYTYVKGLEGEYESSDTKAVGVVVSNSHQTPKMSIENVCYEGSSKTSGAAYIASITNDAGPKDMFKQGCSANNNPFLWTAASRFPLTISFSSPAIFEEEIVAVLPKRKDQEVKMEAIEIWNGLAYCLQEKRTETPDGTVKLQGLLPTLDKFESMCGGPSSESKIGHQLSKVKRSASLSRKKRHTGYGSGIEKCVHCCWTTWGPTGTGKTAGEVAGDGKGEAPPAPPPSGCCNGGV